MLSFSLRQMEVFVSVAENGSFTAAANELVLAQSTVSAHVKGFEDALGVVLLVRDDKKNIKLTEKGREIYSHAKAILAQCHVLSEKASDQTAEQQISIAASTDSFEYLLPEVMAEYLKENSKNRFELVNGDSGFVHEQILKGNARLGFSGTAINRKDFRYRILCRDQLVMITPNNPRYQAMKEQGLYGVDLLEEPMIVRNQNSGTKKEFDRYLEKNGLTDRKLHIVARMNQAEAVKSSVANGLGVAVISEMAAKKYARSGDLIIFQLDPEGAYRNIYLLYRKDTIFSRSEHSFVSFALSHIKKKDN